MTVVQMDFRRPDKSGPVSSLGRVEWKPTARRTEGEFVVLPAAFDVALVEGVASVVVAPSGLGWVWQVKEYVTGGATRYVVVPDQELVAYTDLVAVDPATLEPGAAPDPAWWAMAEGMKVSGEQALAAAQIAEQAKAGAEGAAAAAAAVVEELPGQAEQAVTEQVAAQVDPKVVAAKSAQAGAVTARNEAVQAKVDAVAAKAAAEAVPLTNDTIMAGRIKDPTSATARELSGTIEAAIGAVGVTGYDVILLVGQSNMHGRGTPYGQVTDPQHPLIKQFTNGTTVSAAMEPVGNTGATGIGPGFQFARWYVGQGLNSGRPVLLINAAQGGTPLTRDATPTWKPSINGSLYARAVEWTTAALAIPGSKLVGVLWLQGETDGDLNASGSTYQTELDALITGLRTKFGATVPFVIGQMVPEYLGTGTRSAINAVHADAPNRHAYTGFAASPINGHLGDGNHFNAAGQRIIGKNMFDVFSTVRTGLGGSMTPTAGTVALTLGIAGASIAYSLRKVTDAYSGPAVTVRRSSDSTTQDIGFTGTALDTSALLAFTGSGDGFVTKWFDQSGNGRNVAQADSAKQPKIVSSGAVITSGGKPAVTFDGVDDNLFNTLPALYAAPGVTMVAVIKGAVPSAQSRWWSESISSAAQPQYGLMQPDQTGNTDSTLCKRARSVMPNVMQNPGVADAWTGAGETFNGAVHQITATDSKAALANWLDGTVDVASVTYTRAAATFDRFALGGVIRSGSLAPYAFTLSEVVFWPTVLNTTNRQSAESNQKAFFGTP